MAADSTRQFPSTVLFTLTLLLMLPSSIQGDHHVYIGGNRLTSRACDEIYIVGEGETLHTISDKCDDPFILERNPHIHDPDDVFPGLVIMITPFSRSTKL
ncbi:hypothetical protein F511_03081 [Dorcoceras hygrometricum]|nr:hypothetical protein F511_03081 [Dorcoceras hygrometricum]